ncbi:hypothetical protein HZH68_004037 [Vespula germanica]|uniref:Uncharacterized protein n=1 Tax=Vespula germanica TaxID=30212 RepID=A0A834KMU2_VESGE|nr:hypothetical protein HZH68_004037 [Vespula germanica]
MSDYHRNHVFTDNRPGVLDNKDGFECAIERWESLASRVEESRMASSLHQELSAMLLEFKASHDRLVAYEIVLEQPHILDERINRITSRSELPDEKIYLFLDASGASLVIECSTKERSGIRRETIGCAIENIVAMSVSVYVYIVEESCWGVVKRVVREEKGM